ncbi:MAG TPA: tetratricopeptide repeat protein [Candidatus Paceibacterota bacterium]|nr:tetratricopeptide repeat protein [Candidatus Paceibacterota bacterium]
MKLTSTFFAALAQVLLIALIALIPILFVPIPWIALAQAKMVLLSAGVLLVAASWMIAASIAGRVVLPKSLLIVVGALLPLAYLGSALFSHVPLALAGSGTETDTAAAMALWFGLLAGCAVLLSSGRAITRAYRAILASAAVLEIAELGNFLLSGKLLSFWALTGPAASLVGSWHDFGIFLAFALLLAVAALETPVAAGRWRWCAWAVAILAIPLLFIVNVQSVWIAIAILGVLGAGYAWYLDWQHHRNRDAAAELGALAHRLTFGIFIAMLLLAVAGFFGGSPLAKMLPSSWQVSQTEIRPSWQGTAQIASSVYRGGELLFGSGPNTFNRQWALYKPSGVNETAFWNVDFTQGVGYIPTAFITVGIAGAIVWVVFLLLYLVTALRLLFVRSVHDRVWRMPLFALAASSCYLWVVLAIYAPGQALIAFAFMLTGLLVAGARAAGALPTLSWEFVRSRFGFAYIIVPAIVVIGVASASIGLSRALAADMLVNYSISTYNASGDITAAQSGLTEALAIEPGYDRALRGAVELNLIRFNQLAQSATSSDAVKSQLQDALAAAIKNGLSAVSADTSNYQNWLTLAGAYQQLAGVSVQGAYENAKKAYEKAIAADPADPQPYLALAQLAALQNDATSTRAYLTEALNKKSNYTDALYLLSQVDVSSGDLDSAFKDAVSAVQSDQTQPQLWFQLGAVAYAKQDYADAVTALTRAISLDANFANALYVLGLAYYQEQDATNALAAFEKVAALNPDNQSVRTIVSLLSSGKPLPLSGNGSGMELASGTSTAASAR